MLRKTKSDEHLWICSMGKKFRVTAIATTDEEANAYCAKDRDSGVIATLDPFVFIAELYSGEKQL